MSGFQAPNYTQVPNDYFDLILDMTNAEIRVLSTLLRATLGYHRDEIKLSIREMARITRLDPKSVMAGAVKLEERGLIARSVGKSTTVTKWTVVIDDPKLWEKIVKTVPVGQYENASLPLKKEKKEINPASRPLDLVDAILFYEKPAMSVRQAVSDYFKINVNWDTKTSRQWIEWAMGAQITSEQIKDAAQMWSVDKRFNWSAPTLLKIFENWQLLMGETGADEIYHAGIIELPSEPMSAEEMRFIFGESNV